MNTVELIRKKRDGDKLSKEEIKFLISAFTRNKIPQYQFSAFLMAVYFKGMSVEETSYLTEAMLNSGKIADLSSIKESKIDKHSTGGVGDKTSLIIAPVAAAAGIKVPMISGRGLGHTGGTLDKLESIPGFKTSLTLGKYKTNIKKCGAVLIGQTKDIAPADKLIYSLRDVTATVESIPLITASIMSKKLAEGIDGLVLDIKTGNGAFMKDQKDSETLALSLIKTANDFDKKVIAFITDMNQPLGNYIGNWLEVFESIKALQGDYPKDLMELSITLSGAMIFLGGKAESLEEGKEISFKLIKNGKALEKFLEIVKLQGGDLKFVKHPEKYPKPKETEKIIAEESGYLNEINTFELGVAAAELGAGRKTLNDKIDPKAGIIFKFKLGEKVKKGTVIAELYSESQSKIKNAKKRFQNILKYSGEQVNAPQLIKKVIQ
ncbi:MAG TPA: thymidine phosphorylase [Ignavibacteriaceae bacterium]|nr:thymidine phosphorylase [Ignavibacteriaceae bacterium]